LSWLTFTIENILSLRNRKHVGRRPANLVTHDEARPIAANIAKLPDFAAEGVKLVIAGTPHFHRRPE
jgi:hypothetical protein